MIFDDNLDLSSIDIQKICDRRFGVGADGVLVYTTSNNEKYDFRMTYFNADGGEVEMCGNGARALCHFSRYIKGINKHELSFEAQNEGYRALFLSDNKIRMEMSEIKFGSIDVDDFDPNASYVEVGVPHVVLPKEDFDIDFARRIRRDKRFPKGVNVNFFKKAAGNKYEIRTYERGVEAETYACGTGVTALGAHLFFKDSIFGLKDFKVFIKTRGGDFIVDREKDKFFLTGETEFVFSGEL